MSDKTGTLTRNVITIHRVVSYGPDERDIIFYAFISSKGDERNPIDQAIIARAGDLGVASLSHKVIDFIPADSERKRSSALAEIGGKRVMISVGAPQVIESLSVLDAETRRRFEDDVEEAARQGDAAAAEPVGERAPEERAEPHRDPVDERDDPRFRRNQRTAGGNERLEFES